MSKASIGRLIRDARHKRQESLDVACKSLGIAKSYLWEIEQDGAGISLDKAVSLSDYYEIGLDDMANCIRQKREQ